MKVSEAIEKLTNKRNDALSFMSDIYKKGDAGYLANEIRVTTYNIAINTLQQIDEPQAEKVEITERQERLLKKYEDEPFHRLLNNCRTDDEYLLARARLNGYTVKQEQKYRVRVNGRIVKHLQFLKDNQINSFTENGTPMTFTDKSKAEAVAILVEGSVEEV